MTNSNFDLHRIQKDEYENMLKIQSQLNKQLKDKLPKLEIQKNHPNIRKQNFFTGKINQQQQARQQYLNQDNSIEKSSNDKHTDYLQFRQTNINAPSTIKSVQLQTHQKSQSLGGGGSIGLGNKLEVSESKVQFNKSQDTQKNNLVLSDCRNRNETDTDQQPEETQNQKRQQFIDFRILNDSMQPLQNSIQSPSLEQLMVAYQQKKQQQMQILNNYQEKQMQSMKNSQKMGEKKLWSQLANLDLQSYFYSDQNTQNEVNNFVFKNLSDICSQSTNKNSDKLDNISSVKGQSLKCVPRFQQTLKQSILIEKEQIRLRQSEQQNSSEYDLYPQKKIQYRKHFKTTRKEDNTILQLGPSFSILFEPQNIQKLPKEKQSQINTSIYRDLLAILNFSNNLYINQPPEKNCPIYKAYVGKGNNHMLIRMIIKQRWWWLIQDTLDEDQINLAWTQTKKTYYIESMKCKVNMVASSNKNNFSTNLSESQSNAIQNNLDSQIANSDKNLFSNDDSDFSDQESIKDRFCKNLKLKKTTSATNSQELKKRKFSCTESQTQIDKNDIFEKQRNLFKKFLTNNDQSILFNALKNRGKNQIQDQFFSSINAVKQLKQSQEIIDVPDSQALKLHNHVDGNFHLGSKKLLFYNMRNYYESLKKDVFEYLPITFHIKEGKKDEEFKKFLSMYKQIENDQSKSMKDSNSKSKKNYNIWIVKPGENTNRGCGINVCNQLQQIENIVEQVEIHNNGLRKTYIIQKYMERPMLYNKRKFDIRCFTMFTSVNGVSRGFWYQEGYVRTSSFEFSVKNLDKKSVHLTNDAVQKKNDLYGKFEKGNKISFEELSQYISQNYSDKDFYRDVYPQFKELATDTIKSTFYKLDPDKREHGLEIFGLDFMIDENFKVWLIECNTNPCMELSCTLLSRILPTMIDNAFKIAIDPLFPPPQIPSTSKKQSPDSFIEQNKFELIFDEFQDGNSIKGLVKDNNINWTIIDQIEEEQEDDEVEEV